MNLYTIHCQKVTGALETESFGQNTGQAGTIDCENNANKQNSPIFFASFTMESAPYQI